MMFVLVYPYKVSAQRVGVLYLPSQSNPMRDKHKSDVQTYNRTRVTWSKPECSTPEPPVLPQSVGINLTGTGLIAH